MRKCKKAKEVEMQDMLVAEKKCCSKGKKIALGIAGIGVLACVGTYFGVDKLIKSFFVSKTWPEEKWTENDWAEEELED